MKQFLCTFGFGAFRSFWKHLPWSIHVMLRTLRLEGLPRCHPGCVKPKGQTWFCIQYETVKSRPNWAEQQCEYMQATMKEAGSHKWANLNQRPLVVIDGVSLVIIIIIIIRWSIVTLWFDTVKSYLLDVNQDLHSSLLWKTCFTFSGHLSTVQYWFSSSRYEVIFFSQESGLLGQ